MTDIAFTDDLATWHKATHSGQQGTCVEVARLLHEVVAVRDTTDRPRGHISLPRGAWGRFLADVRT